MPDPDRRDVALGGLAIVVEHADEIYSGPLRDLLESAEPGMTRERPRWLEVLQEMSQGHDRRETGRRLFISEQTVMTHLKRAREALGVKTTVHAIAEALRRGLIE